MGVWQFIQDQVFGMKWLNELIGKGLSKLGLDVGERIGGSIQFFFYDVLKITVLLCLLIFVISYIQSYFPPERSKRILSRTFERANKVKIRPYRPFKVRIKAHCAALFPRWSVKSIAASNNLKAWFDFNHYNAF